MILFESFVTALESHGLQSDMLGNACFILLVCSRMSSLKMDTNVVEIYSIKTSYCFVSYISCAPVVDISSGRTRQRRITLEVMLHSSILQDVLSARVDHLVLVCKV